MAGRGPAAKDPDARTRRNAPAHEWTTSAATGWQHGRVPKIPEGLMPATRSAWKAWFGSWFAAHWKPEDLPGLRIVAIVYDAVERGDLTRAGELRLQMDAYGITPKGQAERRWKPAAAATEATPATGTSRYGMLRAVSG